MIRQQGENNWPWIMATLFAQTAWGAYPVFARYLQTMSLLPSMSIIAFGSLLALAAITILLRPGLDWESIRSVRLLFFAFVVVGRGVTNFLAARYTLAIYVQLITLLTPFLVAIMSRVVLHEKLPRYTGRALVISILGALLIMGGGLSAMDASLQTSRFEWLGNLLALGSSFLLAIYMIAVRGTSRHHISGETLLLVQLSALGATSGIISVMLGEDLSRWTAIQPFDWLVFLLLSFGVLAGANIAQISSIRHLGAAMVSSTMAWRLVSSLILAAFLLNERLTSLVQLLGVALVLVTVTWYLWQQRESVPLRTPAR
jgi:drug/metabolite transporter (DMT)-like permease